DIRAQAEAGFPLMSERLRAMLSGYTQGYNHYLEVTPVSQQDPRCAGQPWLQPISEVDMVTFAVGIALLPGAGQFLAPLFVAALTCLSRQWKVRPHWSINQRDWIYDR
ncbi:MAG: hypothetical protein ABW107_17440, partial [Candidatus Thiodiazotropha sp. 6PLUC5]